MYGILTYMVDSCGKSKGKEWFAYTVTIHGSIMDPACFYQKTSSPKPLLF